jgi:formylglycine-generating enzyme required for sulfatase activity
MVLVPEGEFLYGDKGWFSDMQRLSLPAFYMDKYEVSTKLYATFIQDTGRVQPDDWSKQVALVGSGDRPVVNVTWHDADTYCRHYGKRLPTEQEWEKSARGTDGRKYPWGNEEPSSQYANYGKNYPSNNFYKDRLTPVGNYEAGKSPYGIYDLAGNVWEWTSSDEGSSKVIRGGAWTHGADWLRSTGRANGSPTLRYSYFGFRCAQDAR